MSDSQKQTLQSYGSTAFKLAIVLLGFFAANTFNDMKDMVNEIKGDVKQVHEKVGDTREDVIMLKGTVQAHDDRLDKLETRRK